MSIGSVTDATTLASNGALVPDARLQLTGALRRRHAGYLLEESVDPHAEDGTRWTTPRVYLLETPDVLTDAAEACVNQVVIIGGTPSRRGRRHNTVIVLDSVQLQAPVGPAN